MRVAIGANWFAVHIFHDEIGQAFIGCSAIDEPRDVGMIELRQDLPLIAKATENSLGIESATDELDCDFLAVFIVRPRCEIDSPQTAAADFANDLVSAKLMTDERF